MRNLTLLVASTLALFAAFHLWASRPFTSAEVLSARVHWRQGEPERARQVAAAALPGLQREVAALPADLDRRMALAEALVLAGDAAAGLAEARRAVAADPAPGAAIGWSAVGRESRIAALAAIAAEAGPAAAGSAAAVAHGGPAQPQHLP